MKKNLLCKRVAALVLSAVLMGGSLTACQNTDTAGAGESQKNTGASAQTETPGESGETAAPETEVKTENEPVDPDAVAIEIGDTKVKASELFYYYYVYKMQSEMGGVTDWALEMSAGVTYGDYLKMMTENQVLQAVFLTQKAAEKGIEVEVTSDDQADIDDAVASFFANVSQDDQKAYGFTEDNVREVITNSLKISKILNGLVEQGMTELTQEERDSCVYRTVQHILFKTKTPETGESGESVDNSEVDDYNAQQKAKAEDVLARAQNGEDFETLAEEFNEDGGFEYSLNKDGQTPDGSAFVQEFVDGSNALNEGEFTLVQTEYGYHVIKCVTVNDEEAGQTAKENLVLSKLQSDYGTWLNENTQEFYDFWQNYAVLNPTADLTQDETGDTTQAETGETMPASETAAVDEMESDQSEEKSQTAADTENTDAETSETTNTETQNQ